MKKSTKIQPLNTAIVVAGTKTEMAAIKKAAKKLKTTPEGFLLYLADNYINSK